MQQVFESSDLDAAEQVIRASYGAGCGSTPTASQAGSVTTSRS